MTTPFSSLSAGYASYVDTTHNSPIKTVAAGKKFTLEPPETTFRIESLGAGSSDLGAEHVTSVTIMVNGEPQTLSLSDPAAIEALNDPNKRFVAVAGMTGGMTIHEATSDLHALEIAARNGGITYVYSYGTTTFDGAAISFTATPIEINPQSIIDNGGRFELNTIIDGERLVLSGQEALDYYQNHFDGSESVHLKPRIDRDSGETIYSIQVTSGTPIRHSGLSTPGVRSQTLGSEPVTVTIDFEPEVLEFRQKLVLRFGHSRQQNPMHLHTPQDRPGPEKES